MNRLRILPVLMLTLLASHHAFSQTQNSATVQEHMVWLGEQIKQLKSIKAGMTRADVRKILGTEGGLSTRTQRTYVTKECLYCKVQITFQPVGAAEEGLESGRDVVAKVSEPFLEFAVMD